VFGGGRKGQRNTQGNIRAVISDYREEVKEEKEFYHIFNTEEKKTARSISTHVRV